MSETMVYSMVSHALGASTSLVDLGRHLFADALLLLSETLLDRRVDPNPATGLGGGIAGIVDYSDRKSVV